MRTSRAVAISFMSAVLLVPGAAVAGEEIAPLNPGDVPDLVYLLNEAELIAKSTFKNDRTPAFSYYHKAKIWKVRDPGFEECDGAPDRCPTYSLYLAVAGAEMYATRAVYGLPKLPGWKFIGWVSEEGGEFGDGTFTVELERKFIRPGWQYGDAWFEKEIVRVTFDLEHAKIERLKTN